jgi:hypothetical protein
MDTTMNNNNRIINNYQLLLTALNDIVDSSFPVSFRSPQVIVSPCFRLPTPSGVPVKITSPGSNFIIELTYSSRNGILNIMSFVCPFCFRDSSTLHQSERLWGSDTSCFGMNGPIGVKVSNPFAIVQGSPAFCAAFY